MGIDSAYVGSAFGIVVIQWVDGIVQIMHHTYAIVHSSTIHKK
jgi:hypothetical protein